MGRPRGHPDPLLGDKGYDSSPDIEGLGKLRYVVSLVSLSRGLICWRRLSRPRAQSSSTLLR
ncbi:hypothetical protein [Streptomyces sp. NBC_01615]|uniref:hypothetical protein n=1 Tax=Streptomyces sp. NBC_01615 TaxID=2975898 RepID=UPI00386E1EA2